MLNLSCAQFFGDLTVGEFQRFLFPDMVPGRKCWGTKNDRVTTASEGGQKFTDNTFQIDLKCESPKNITSKLQKCQQFIAIFKN